MSFLNLKRGCPKHFLFLKRFVVVCILASYVQSVYAIPPPETLALLGGSLIYPGILIVGVLSLLLKYIWVKTKLYLVWRLYLGRVVCFVFILALFFSIPLFNQWVNNHPVSIKTIKSWQQSDSKPVFIDLRNNVSYEKIHLLGAINFPNGSGLTQYLITHPSKRMILYCESGVRSANLIGLYVDPSVLKQALNENRLFMPTDGVPGARRVMW